MSDMVKFFVYCPCEAEYSKADKDPSYAPKEDLMGFFYSVDEREANRMLAKAIHIGMFPRGSQALSRNDLRRSSIAAYLKVLSR